MFIQEIEIIFAAIGMAVIGSLFTVLLRLVVYGTKRLEQIDNIAAIAKNHGLKKRFFESQRRFQERVFDFIYNRK